MCCDGWTLPAPEALNLYHAFPALSVPGKCHLQSPWDWVGRCVTDWDLPWKLISTSEQVWRNVFHVPGPNTVLDQESVGPIQPGLGHPQASWLQEAVASGGYWCWGGGTLKFGSELGVSCKGGFST